MTTTCVRWLKLIELSNAYPVLEESLEFVNKKYKADILAYVLMPNHIHFIVYFKEENRLSDYMRDFKKFTSTMIRKALDKPIHQSLLDSIRHKDEKRVFQIWQDRFDDVYIADTGLLEIKLNYIHENPLQDHWNLAEYPENYPYSSAMFYELDKQPGCRVTHYKEYF